VFDVQPSLGCEFVGNPSTIVNVLRFRAFGSIVDRVERQVGARKDLKLKLGVFLPLGSESLIAPGAMSNGKVKDLGVADSTVQQDITCFHVGLLFDRDALVAAVLHDEVMILPRARGVPIDGDGGVHGAVPEPAVSKGDALRLAAASVLPKGEDVLCLVPRVGTEIEMPAQAEPADLG
jgi:hypothetical protein